MYSNNVTSQYMNASYNDKVYQQQVCCQGSTQSGKTTEFKKFFRYITSNDTSVPFLHFQ